MSQEEAKIFLLWRWFSILFEIKLFLPCYFLTDSLTLSKPKILV
jgi:hypothetical protein